MIDHTLRFMSPAERGVDLDPTSDEPSHIHIARPSRLLRRGTAADHVDPSAETLRQRDPSATQVTGQAA